MWKFFAVLKKYIEAETLDTADVVYCSMLEAEEIALQTKRAMRKRLEGDKVICHYKMQN